MPLITIVALGLVIAAGAMVFLTAVYRAARDVARDRRRLHLVRHVNFDHDVQHLKAAKAEHEDHMRHERDKVDRERGGR